MTNESFFTDPFADTRMTQNWTDDEAPVCTRLQSWPRKRFLDLKSCVQTPRGIDAPGKRCISVSGSST